MTVNDKVSSNYHILNPEAIALDINASFNTAEPKTIQVMNVEFMVYPHVYPSQKFRSTNVMLSTILKFTPSKSICEIGCGCGTLGQIALLHGASRLIQADINPYAVENAKINKESHCFSDKQLMVYESDCFENIPDDCFDIIIFAMPYHSNDIKIEDPLLYAFYDPNFASIRKFVLQVVKYVHAESQIFISFSNKGDTASLEQIFEHSKFSWELHNVTNRETEYDNRVYRLFLDEGVSN